MNQKLSKSLEEIQALIRAHIPIIWVVTHEENRFTEEFISKIVDQKKDKVWLWTQYRGLVEAKEKSHFLSFRANGPDKETPHPQKALFTISEHQKDNDRQSLFYIMKDFHSILAEPVVRQLKDMYTELILTNKTIVIISPNISYGVGGQREGLPITLEKQITVVDYELPTKNEILEYVKGSIPHMGLTEDPSNEDIYLTTKALQGLTFLEIDNSLSTSIVKYKNINIDFLISNKKQILKKSQTLEFIDNNVTLEDVGGLDLLKKYLSKYAKAHTEEAQKYGVEPLKGVLLVGIPGGGKSLIAKTIGTLWKQPLLRLDVGKVMSGLVGSSEAKMRETISIACSMSPACLWLDEIEKNLSGTKSSNYSVSGNEYIWAKIDGDIDYLSMKSLHRTWFEGQASIEVLALNNKTFRLEWKKIEKSLEHKTDQPLFKVKTLSGREVTATKDHSFVTLNENGELQKTLTQELLGQMIPVATNIWIEPKLNKIDFSKYNTLKTHHKMNDVLLNRDFGRLIGLWLAEGSINEDSVQFACTEQSIITFILEMVKKIWPNKNVHHSFGAIQISSRPFSNWIKENFVCGASEKQIPELLIETPKEFRLGILEGAISGDGSACYTNSGSMDLTIASTSKDLLYGYMLLINSLGARCNIQMPYSPPSHLEHYKPIGSINIANLDYNLFTLVSEEKQLKLDQYKLGQKQTHRPSDRIPLPKNVIKKLGLNKQNKNHEILRTKVYRGRLSANKVEEYIKDVPNSEAKQLMLNLCHGDVRWDIVKSIELAPSEEIVYDIEVKDNHTFTLASGLVVHNSDGGTLSRVFGTLLTAMEESLTGISIIATANDINALPPEFIRRFNDVFFVDLPTPEERWEIFKIHLKKRNRDIKDFENDKNELLKKSNGYTGAEIEKAIKDAIASSFMAGKENIDKEALLTAIEETKPISKIMASSIKKLRQDAKTQYRFASSLAEQESQTKKITTKKGKELNVNKALDDMNELHPYSLKNRLAS